ncbi:MAG TPA: hypothetical protein VFG05_02800 [Methylocella sp.]|nr:hypothetical protein [Methylocella sp.]
MAAQAPFDRNPDAGFIRAYDARAARRQFQISVTLVLLLAVAAGALGCLMQLGSQALSARSAPWKAPAAPLAGPSSLGTGLPDIHG